MTAGRAIAFHTDDGVRECKAGSDQAGQMGQEAADVPRGWKMTVEEGFLEAGECAVEVFDTGGENG